MPGDRITSRAPALLGTLDDSFETIPEVLLRLHPDHQYRRIWDRRYVPREADDPSRFTVARRAVLAIILADAPYVENPDERPHFASSRRGRSLLRYVYYRVGEDPEALDPPVLLNSDNVRAWGVALVASKRITQNSADHMIGDVLSFQRAFPADFRPRHRRRKREPDVVVPHLSDAHFKLALRQADAINDPDYRAQAVAQLLLNRGAGASNVDSRYVTGRDIQDRGPLGTWVVFTAPGREREVPVLRRFAAQLLRLAAERPDRSLIGSGAVPARRPQPVDMLRDLNLRLRAKGHKVSITTERLRKAWQWEVHSGGASLGTVAALSCISSIAHMRWILDAGPPPSDPAELARAVGALRFDPARSITSGRSGVDR